MLNPPYILDLSHAELIFIHKSLMDVIPAKAGIQEKAVWLPHTEEKIRSVNTSD